MPPWGSGLCSWGIWWTWWIIQWKIIKEHCHKEVRIIFFFLLKILHYSSVILAWHLNFFYVVVRAIDRSLVKAGGTSLRDTEHHWLCNTRGSTKDLDVKNNSLKYSPRRNILSRISLNALLDKWMLEGCLQLLEKT